MSNPEYQEIIQEYKEQVRILKQEVAELQDAGKSKDSANKRTLQKLEHITQDLDDAKKKIKELENKKNKITKYRIEVVSKLEILFLSKKIKKEFTIFEEGYYNVTDNNNTNRENQKQLENNLSENISQEIIKNIFRVINDN